MRLVQTRRANGELAQEEWQNENGRAHREDGPARIVYREDGTVQREVWIRDGVTHREDGPAIVEHYFSASSHETYYRHGIRHRSDGPAEIWRDYDGEIEGETYYVDGKKHRIDGPAELDYDEGRVMVGDFYLYGKKATGAVFARFAEAIESGAPEEWARAYAFADEAGS